MANYIPVYDLGEPGRSGGYSISLNLDDAIYSTYSGKQVSIGGIEKGTTCDAPRDHKNHGKAFHVIERDSKGNLMAHGVRSRR
ncbi:MAG: hypothetical protein CMF62_03895 [Magnetococcales bacterium]|nr:hypothetical protein [Magnetococcales bacterium]|tara:strand:- start:21847 stop:22095 length:249 start_codon:yes stop_codon:yes gene_type:complete